MPTPNSTDQEQSWPPFSHAQCIGNLIVDGLPQRSMPLVRNTGGGTSVCCSHFVEASPARSSAAALQLPLPPRIAGHPNRNAARVYLAEECVEGSFADTRYAAIPLLGRTISVTVDLSAAKCGCNVAFYLTSLRQNVDDTSTGIAPQTIRHALDSCILGRI